MAGPIFDAAERAQLSDLLDELGPQAPTLLVPWTARDIAAHLVLRERDPVAGPGLVLPGPWRRLAERRQEALRGAGLELQWAGTTATVRARRGEPTARITGAPGELLLYLFGRQDAAHVEVSGVSRVRCGADRRGRSRGGGREGDSRRRRWPGEGGRSRALRRRRDRGAAVARTGPRPSAGSGAVPAPGMACSPAPAATTRRKQSQVGRSDWWRRGLNGSDLLGPRSATVLNRVPFRDWRFSGLEGAYRELAQIERHLSGEV
jgi:hypothetical protein